MYFYSQAHDLAVSLNAPRLVSKVLFKRIQLGVRAAKMQDVERDTLHLRSLATEVSLSMPQSRDAHVCRLILSAVE